ncbi:hypothetical protein ACFE04_030824 [Oxalis oulophora]
MTLNLCLIIFTIITLLVIISSSSESIDPYYLDCKYPNTTTCGDGQVIKYPFYIKSKQNSICSYPGFDISCNIEKHPVLKFENNDNDYVIKKFYYHNYSILVSNDAASACPNKVRNISLPLDRYRFLDNDQKYMIILSDCNNSSHVKSEYYKVKECTNETVFAMMEDEWNHINSTEFGNCSKKVLAPVNLLHKNESVSSDVKEVMRRGFELKWIAGTCNDCEDSRGYCGFNITTYKFACFCTDRPHARKCASPAVLKELDDTFYSSDEELFKSIVQVNISRPTIVTTIRIVWI